MTTCVYSRASRVISFTLVAAFSFQRETSLAWVGKEQRTVLFCWKQNASHPTKKQHIGQQALKKGIGGLDRHQSDDYDPLRGMLKDQFSIQNPFEEFVPLDSTCRL